MCSEADDKKCNTEIGSKSYVVMYYDKDRSQKGLVLLTRMGREPLTLNQAISLAESYTNEYGTETFILCLAKRIRRVAPVERNDCISWPY